MFSWAALFMPDIVTKQLYRNLETPLDPDEMTWKGRTP